MIKKIHRRKIIKKRFSNMKASVRVKRFKFIVIQSGFTV